MINENAGQLVTDRLVDQHGCDRGIHAAGQAADHLGIADLGPDFGNGFGAVGAHGPVALEPRHSDEVRIKQRAFGGMVHLGVKLHRVKLPGWVGGDGKGRVGRGAVGLKSGGDGGHMVTMAHPDLFTTIRIPAVQQSCGAVCRGHKSPAKFGGAMATLDPPAQQMHHHLLAVANAQHRHAKAKDACGRHRCAVGENRGRSARQDDGLGREISQKRISHFVERMDFAIDIQFAQAPRDQLRHLGTKVDDQKAVMLGHWG